MKNKSKYKTILLCPTCGNEVNAIPIYKDVICPWCRKKSLKAELIREKASK